MKSLPLPFRVAAGLAATAVEQARELPAKLAGLPVTVASQAMQLSMRVQQQVTSLAIKGDEALAALRQPEETPEWATFDEDVERYDVSTPRPAADQPDPWEMESSAIAESAGAEAVTDAEVHTGAGTGAGPDVPPPAALPNYDELSLPQLRARLRSFSPAELRDLLAYEEATAARPSFTGMLTRRINSVTDSPRAGEPTDDR